MEIKSLVPKIMLPAKKPVKPGKRKKKNNEVVTLPGREIISISEPKENRAKTESIAVFLMSFSLVTFIFFWHGLSGKTPLAGATILDKLFINFGLTIFFIPLFFLHSGLNLFFQSSNKRSGKNIYGFAILYISVLGLLGQEGGRLGGWLNNSIATWIGPLPTTVFFIGLFASAIVLLFNDIYKRILKAIFHTFCKSIWLVITLASSTMVYLWHKSIVLFNAVKESNQLMILREKDNQERVVFKEKKHPAEVPEVIRASDNITSNIESTETFGLDDRIDQSGIEQRSSEEINGIRISEKQKTPPVEMEKKVIIPHNSQYRIPGLHLLSQLNCEILEEIKKTNSTYILEKKEILMQCFQDFRVAVEISSVTVGSSIIRYEVRPDKGIPVNHISRLKNDIALYLATESVRIEAPISGKDAVGIEIPLKKSYPVNFVDFINDKKFIRYPGPLYLALGKNIAGENIFADLSRMPHLLIAGQTGAGKSVCMNCIINSILYRATPDEVRFIMIDPKVVELSIYNSLPHLLAPVVTDPTEAPAVLMWAVEEMERRYLKLERFQTRNISSYNKKVQEYLEKEPESADEELNPLPYIVIFIDELNDLMMVARKEVEANIIRIAQKARAVGMHLVVATQRPSKDVITGVLKGNLPSRIAFQVASWVDSKTILDRAGAEVLLGKGDMLFTPVGKPKPVRVQGAFISDEECLSIIDYFKAQNHQTDFVDLRPREMTEAENETININDIDPKINEILEYLYQEGEASVSSLQRRFSIGYNRSARIMDKLNQLDLLETQKSGVKKRKVKHKICEYVSKTGEYVS
ncbi:DNA translocase FtsK 4TM domain-containing protein [Candidatus Riflebacteria bacterium]